MRRFLLFLVLAFSCIPQLIAQPAIKVIRESLILGDLPISRQYAEFDVLCVNAGDSPLYLTDVRSTCPCVESDFQTEAVIPGDTTSIHVVYHFKYLGDFSYPLWIYYNSEDPEDRFVADFYGKTVLPVETGDSLYIDRKE